MDENELVNPQIKLYADGCVRSEKWYNDDGVFHCVDGPACSYWGSNGVLYAQNWRLNGKSHRSCGPAFQEWHSCGILKHNRWCINGNDISAEVEQWIKENNINLDENHCVVDKNYQIIFRLKWG